MAKTKSGSDYPIKKNKAKAKPSPRDKSDGLVELVRTPAAVHRSRTQSYFK